MNYQHVFPLGLYLHVAAGTELMWMYVNGVAPALLSQGSHDVRLRELDPQDLVAVVVQSGVALVKRVHKHEVRWSCWYC